MNRVIGIILGLIILGLIIGAYISRNRNRSTSLTGTNTPTVTETADSSGANTTPTPTRAPSPTPTAPVTNRNPQTGPEDETDTIIGTIASIDSQVLGYTDGKADVVTTLIVNESQSAYIDLHIFVTNNTNLFNEKGEAIAVDNLRKGQTMRAITTPKEGGLEAIQINLQ